ncbi:MAG: NADH-quinone oxidoreductase subunit NuoH [Bacteroidetes bacterium]|nr:NADH-quinone oxidoreductase subunit NuoH [Bacteroidota bacterium]
MIITALIIAISVITLFAVLGLVLVYMERKVAAFMQIRLGPMRVGPWGIAQTLADTVKLISKEDIIPNGADKFLFNLAPLMVTVIATLALAPLPFSDKWIIWDSNVGVFYVAAISSLTVISILTGGWASNNKYSLIGAMRSGAQIVSYELSVGLSLVAMVLLSGSLSFSDIVMTQQDAWWIFKGHLPAWIAFMVFIIASTAELNRNPFDLPEAESELTAGFHTEYSGMKFALFMLSEYINMFIVSAVAATLFLGGWMPLHFGQDNFFNHIMDYIPPLVWFAGKVFFIIFLIMWFRWTFPRLRIDQLLTLEWKYLLPISLINVLAAAWITVTGWHF